MCDSKASLTQTERKLRILLAEDDEDDFFLFQLAVQKSKYPLAIVRARDGAEAIDLLNKKTVPPPDVIITDIKMPKANGFDLLMWLKENPTTAKIPSIILSGSDAPKDKARGKALGVAAYHVKNGDPKAMEEVIAQIYQSFYLDTQS